MDEDTPLAELYITYTDNPNNADKTFNDFFDDCGIPMESRNDCAVVAMIKQAREILEND